MMCERKLPWVIVCLREGGRKARFSGWSGLVGALISMVSFAGVPRAAMADEPANARELLGPVIEAVKAIEHPFSGRGSASVKVLDPKGYHEHRAVFRFKDERLSRTDWFDLQDEQRQNRQFAWSMGRQVYAGCNSDNALVLAEPSNQFHAQFGYDFHPSTFAGMDDLTVAENLQWWIKECETLSVSMDDRNLLRIKGEYPDLQGKDDDDVERLVLVLDKTMGFRPVFYQMTWSYLAPGKLSWGSEYHISWKPCGRTWYVSEAEYRHVIVGSYVAGEDPCIVGLSPVYTKFVIDDFTPDVNIPDSEFTLDGLAPREGTLVYDALASISYRYGTPPVTSEMLEAAANKAAFPQKIAASTPPAEPAPEPPPPETPGGGPPVLGDAGPSYWRYVLPPAIAALILLGILCGRRRLLICRKE